MKIAHFPGTFFPNIGGVEIVVHNLAKAQVMLGHDVTVFVLTSFPLKMKQKYPKDMPYRIVRIMPKTMGILRYLSEKHIHLDFILNLQLFFYQKKYNFDVWHFSSLFYQAFISVPFFLRKKVPIVGTCHGADIQEMPEINYGLRSHEHVDNYFRRTIPHFNILTAISQSIRNDYLELGIANEKIVDIPNGIDVNKFKQTDCNKLQFRGKYNWPTDKKVLITVGRNHPKKGYMHIPFIIRELIKLRSDFVWVIIGKGCKPIIEKAKKFDVQKHLIIMGELGISLPKTSLELSSAELIKAYKAADVFVFPTLIESFGIVQIEAMAAGLPVVTTNAHGCRDLVCHEKNGLVSEVKDTRQMAENIDRILSDKGLRENIIQNGLDTCENYRWPDIASKYCQAYEKAIFAKAGPA